jgi:hypothetical protein
VSGERLEDFCDRLGDPSAERPVQDEHGQRGQAMERGTLARLGCEEVAPLLAGERRNDDAADAHRPRPGHGLGVDPRADDEDRAGRANVDHPRQ